MIRILAFVCVLAVSACTSTPSPMGKPLPHFDYSALNPYFIRQGHAEIKESYLQYKRPNQPDFVRSPEITFNNYAYNRFDTKAGKRRLVFDIQRLNLIRSKQELKYFESLFGDQKDVYMLDFVVAMVPVDSAGKTYAAYTISFKKRLVLTPDMSVAEREFRQFEFLETVMSTLDKGVTEIVTKLNN